MIYLRVGGMPHIVGKLSIRVTTFFQTSPQSKVCIKSYGIPKSQESQFQEFWDSQLWSLRTKWHLGASSMAKHSEYYKGESWWLPPSLGRVDSCESMFAHGSFMHQKCSYYALTNLLFRLCKFVWIIDVHVIRPSPHLKVPACPSIPKVLRAKEHNPTHYPSIIFAFGLIIDYIKEFGSASFILIGISCPFLMPFWAIKKNSVAIP
jgi:hypothetical protein